MMRIYYVANARMPTEKAHGIQIAKMCEALIEQGADVELIVPRRHTDTRSVKEFYGLRVDVPMTYLWTPDWYDKGRIGYWISSLFFMFGYSRYLRRKKKDANPPMIWTIDIDQFSFCLVPFVGMPYLAEIHDAKSWSVSFAFLLRHACRIIVINDIIRRELHEAFSIAMDRFLVCPNGVDLGLFRVLPKDESRSKLYVPAHIRMALYVGRFYPWKELKILADAAYALRGIYLYIVGGSADEFQRVTGAPDIPDNLIFAGEKGFSEIPLWLAAADVFIVCGTQRNDYSRLHTSPMKLFEYMAMGFNHAIVASDTPANRQILSDEEATFYEADSAEDLAKKIRYVFDYPSEAMHRKGGEALKKVQAFTWEKRASAILKTFQHS